MMVTAYTPEGSGLDVADITGDPDFATRRRRDRDPDAQLEGMRTLAHTFVESPATILQELVNLAVTLCGADSAGISIEREEGNDAEFYHWVATAGEYSGFMDAILPRYPSACGLCIERGRPQNFRVSQEFFSLLGVEAPLVTDGILLPWQVDSTRGTIFIMAHGRTEAFDLEDAKLMQLLADFAAMGYRQHRLQQQLTLRERNAAAAEMANKLAHRINNPLQSLTNTMFLAELGHHGEEARALGAQASEDLRRLSTLVARLLALPYSHNEP